METPDQYVTRLVETAILSVKPGGWSALATIAHFERLNNVNTMITTGSLISKSQEAGYKDDALFDIILNTVPPIEAAVARHKKATAIYLGASAIVHEEDPVRMTASFSNEQKIRNRIREASNFGELAREYLNTAAMLIQNTMLFHRPFSEPQESQFMAELMKRTNLIIDGLAGCGSNDPKPDTIMKLIEEEYRLSAQGGVEARLLSPETRGKLLNAMNNNPRRTPA